MSKLIVQSVQAKEPFNMANGQLYPFRLMGLLDGQLDAVDMNFKSPENAPKVNDELEITVETTPYGKKGKKVSPAFGGARGGSQAPARPENNRSYALSYAKDIVVAEIAAKKGSATPIADALKYAEAFVAWLDNKQLPGHQVFAERNAEVQEHPDEFTDVLDDPQYQ